MIRTTYTCDRCGEESDKSVYLHNVVVGIRAAYPHYGGHVMAVGNSKRRALSVEWCEPCCNKAGIGFPPKPEDDEKPPEPPTLEELIREIAAEKAQEVMEQ